jgi:hypothetical protein
MIYNLEKNRKKRRVERVATRIAGNYFSYGQPGQMLHDCPGRVAGGGDAGG